MNLSKKKFPGKLCQCGDKAQCRQRMAQVAKSNMVTILVMATRQQSRGQGLTMAQQQQQALSGGLKGNGRTMLGPGRWTGGQEGCCGVGIQQGLMEMEKHRYLSPLCALLCSLFPDALTQEIVLTSINIKSIILSTSYYCRKM